MMRIAWILPLVVFAGCLSASAPPTVSPDLPVITYCELIRLPAKYDQQIVRVKATYLSGYEASVLSADGCDHRTWVEFAPEYPVNTSRNVHNAFHSLDGPTEVIAVGIFTGVGPAQTIFGRTFHQKFGHLNGYDFNFKVLALEGVRPTHYPREHVPPN